LQDAGADVLQDGPAEEEEPGSGKVACGVGVGGKPLENLGKIGKKTMNIIWKQIGNNMEHLISQSHVETMHDKLDGRKTKTIEHPGTTLKQLGIFRIQPSIS
jgi:hypothetical protein